MIISAFCLGLLCGTLLVGILTKEEHLGFRKGYKEGFEACERVYKD